MSITAASTISTQIWNLCTVLRDDGFSYGDYLQELIYLLFLKMDDEARKVGMSSDVPEAYSWQALRLLDGEELLRHYIATLDALGSAEGILGAIFNGAETRFKRPARLRRMVELIDSQTWRRLNVDVKGEIYESLLERNARDTKSGAGQYFTPRPLIDAIVDVMQPRTGQTICDPACGTGGFLLSAYEYITKHSGVLDYEQQQHLYNKAFAGWEIVPATARMGLMNLYLHGIVTGNRQSPIHVEDSLAALGSERFDMVLTNPPFGKKSGDTIVTVDGKLKTQTAHTVRSDFWTSTSNKQLNFVQHVYSILATNGRAAVVVPDNVLFEGGAGEVVRRNLLEKCNVHTLLRLPTGIFYAQGVKANVLFFDKRPGSEEVQTKELWIYDLRTNRNFTLKQNPLERTDLDEFVTLYRAGDVAGRAATWSAENSAGRWRRYTWQELATRDKLNLDITWLKDESLEESANLPEPDVLAAEIIEDLRAALEEFEAVLGDLGGESHLV